MSATARENDDVLISLILHLNLVSWGFGVLMPGSLLEWISKKTNKEVQTKQENGFKDHSTDTSEINHKSSLTISMDSIIRLMDLIMTTDPMVANLQLLILT